ncbi:MAG TPA: class I SAM-dependent methyltransferase [Pyrinomonadaceae bacterium]|jgi:2-polyprenyl-3-methyl-5-hydroxy-6-metoxy-1,4-benzoquinol methylase|nr:class I SAM-dependent methyltransferase [Pyrinomonadaceae bacterium]
MKLSIASPRVEHFYDALAPHFREYCRTKAAYLNTVDQLLIKSISAGADSLLDVGAGDGLRAARLAQSRQFQTLVLVDPSDVMATYCQQRNATEVWCTTAEELPESDRRFDVITCLWNVLGHVPDHEKRLTALHRMSSLLTEDGQIFLDVNNRYNARAYGWLPTLGRVLYDRVRPSATNGDVTFSWQLDDRVIQARGHVFTPGEMTSLINGAGLRVERRFIVDYQTGQLRRRIITGQLLYELRRL